MVISNESFRSQALSKYYKEDLVNVLREFYTMEQLQEVLEIDLENQENLMEILCRGMKKEDLNIILFNSRNITEEALENFRKPTLRRNTVIVFRDVNLDKSSFQEESLGEIPQSEELKEIETQSKNQDQSFNVERIFSPHQKNIDKSFNAEGIFSLPQENLDKTFNVESIISPREEFEDKTDIQQNHLGESFNSEGIFLPNEKNLDVTFNVEGNILTVNDSTDEIALQTKILKNDSLNENFKETFLLSLNHIKNLSHTKDKFKERLKNLVRKQVDDYDKYKSRYTDADRRFQFFKQHIVPMAKFYNIPLEPYLARESITFDRHTRTFP